MSYSKPEFKSQYENFIGGEWWASVDGEYFDDTSPVDGSHSRACYPLPVIVAPSNGKSMRYYRQDARLQTEQASRSGLPPDRP